jgi:ATP-dependent Clp protease ATP-binding subunit ClpX
VVNTSNILFIMSGAFGDLAEIIKKRLQKQGIGFEADVRPTEIPWEILKEVRAQDLIEFGFESEFVGRLPVVVVFDELTKEDLLEILRNPNNPIILSKRIDFRAYGIDIKFEDDALSRIAEMAAEEKTGARGLVSAMEKVLIPFEKKLPSSSVRKFLVTRDVVEAPEAQLRMLLDSPDDPERAEQYERGRQKEREAIKRYLIERAEDFSKRCGLDIYPDRMDLVAELYLVNITDIDTAVEDFSAMYDQVKLEEAALMEKLEVRLAFDESAVDGIIGEAIRTGQEPGPLTFQLAKRLEYGLRLVKDRSGIDKFTISADAVEDMEGFINDLIKSTYREEAMAADLLK